MRNDETIIRGGEQDMELNEDMLIEYVQSKLLNQGYAVDKEALRLIFDYEMQYMIENGFVEINEIK